MDISDIQLKGNAKNMYARLYDYSQLNAKNFRVENIWIQTKDFSSANIFPTKSLQAFAVNHSNIYFFNRPENISRNTKQSGNILEGYLKS